MTGQGGTDVPRFVKLREYDGDLWVNVDAVMWVSPCDSEGALVRIFEDRQPAHVRGQAADIVRLLEDAKLESLSYGGTE